tara:strand:- start:7478 stop:8350 length:873 start_codon:yes stop_codon:yes gene_type:complete
MKNLVTLIIPSYRSKKLIIKHIKNFYDKYQIIIIENSRDSELKKIIKKDFPKVSIYLKKNIGYGKAVNFAAKKVRTKFFFVMNPDAIIYKKTINNLIIAAKKIQEFGAVGPIYENNKKKYNKKVIEVTKLVSAAMLINKNIFLKLNGYDENFFLYYEDDDFFLKCNLNNLKLFLVTNSLIKHKKTKTVKKTLNLHSTTFSNFKERNSTFLVGGWHGQWSKFYFFKKNYGFIVALRKCLPNNFLNIFQIILFIFINPSKAKYKYFKFEGFICSLFGLPAFKRSLYDNQNLY